MTLRFVGDGVRWAARPPLFASVFADCGEVYTHTHSARTHARTLELEPPTNDPAKEYN